MSQLAVFVGFLAVVGLIAFLSWYLSADARAKRLMKAVPKRSIKDVMEGERVRIVGTVEVDDPLQSPVSGRPCAYWRIVVEQRVRSGKNHRWKTIIDEHQGIDFSLVDGTGKAFVRVAHSNAVLDGDHEGSSGFLSDPSEEFHRFLTDHGHDTKGWLLNKPFRYREGVAEPGEVVAVVGTGRWERDPDEKAQAGQGYREARSPRRLVMSAPAGGPLMLSDVRSVTSA